MKALTSDKVGSSVLIRGRLHNSRGAGDLAVILSYLVCEMKSVCLSV